MTQAGQRVLTITALCPSVFCNFKQGRGSEGGNALYHTRENVSLKSDGPRGNMGESANGLRNIHGGDGDGGDDGLCFQLSNLVLSMVFFGPNFTKLCPHDRDN